MGAAFARRARAGSDDSICRHARFGLALRNKYFELARRFRCTRSHAGGSRDSVSNYLTMSFRGGLLARFGYRILAAASISFTPGFSQVNCTKSYDWKPFKRFPLLLMGHPITRLKPGVNEHLDLPS